MVVVRVPDGFDVTVQKVWIREHTERHFPQVELIRLDRATTFVDPLYHEAPARRWLDPIPLWASVQHRPSKKALTKYGIEQSRDVLFDVSTLHLSELGILEQSETFLIGDLIRWGGDHYEIKDQIRDTSAYWGTTNIPFFLVLGADYYREGT